MEQKITALTIDDQGRLARQILRVEQLAAQHLNRRLPKGDGDLDVLQALLDAKAIAATETYELQCLGIVLGTRLIDHIPGLDWVIVEDEYGRDPALRYRDAQLLLFPLTMISKRVEDGEIVLVRRLVELTREHVERLKPKVGWTS